MKVLVTGGSGFIGTNLVEYYLNKGVEVLNIDIVAPRNIDLWGYRNRNWRQVDIRDFGALRAVFANFRPTHVVNLAAQTGTSDRGRTIGDYDTNYVGLISLAEAATATPSVERLVSASSMLVCRSGYKPKSDTDYCPPNLYGRSKVLGEEVLKGAKDLPFSWVIVRPTGIWGPWFEMPYKTLFNLIRRGLYVHPGDSHPKQSLGFVGNTVCQIDRLLHTPSEKVHGKVFYLADYPPTDMREWVELIQRAFKARRILQAPFWALKTMAVAGDIAKLVGWDVPLLSSSRLENMLMSFMVDLPPILVRGLPYTLGQATRKTVEWMKVYE